MTSSLDRYLNEKFPGLKLESPLFYNADIGIRFEIGDPEPSASDEEYREQVHFRSTQLFKNAHSDSDELFIVLFLDLQRKSKPYKLNVFNRGVKNKNILKNLSCKSIKLCDEEDDGWEYYRYVLNCKTSDVKPVKFLNSNYRIFFINKTRDTIFYFYDSRGLDVVSNSTASLNELYFNYNSWILSYDREKIDSVFKS